MVRAQQKEFDAAMADEFQSLPGNSKMVRRASNVADVTRETLVFQSLPGNSKMVRDRILEKKIEQHKPSFNPFQGILKW